MELTSTGRILLLISSVICLQIHLASGRCYYRSSCSDHGCFSNNKCHCDHGYRSTKCNIADPCYQNNPCHNGGTCHFTYHYNRHYYCDCPTEYQGSTCTLANPCSHNHPCKNGGTCHFTYYNQHHYTCSCTAEFHGSTCSDRKVPLATHKPAQTTTKETTTKPTVTSTTSATTATTTMSHTTSNFRACVELITLIDFSNGKISTNENASSCHAGDHTGSEAFVLNHCKVTPPSHWKRGQKVLSICDTLPLYRAIATFTTTNAYIPGFDHSGIFLGCFGDEFQIGMQTCDGGLTIRHIRTDGTGQDNASLYYTIQ